MGGSHGWIEPQGGFWRSPSRGASALAGCSSPGAGGSTPKLVLFAGPTVRPPRRQRSRTFIVRPSRSPKAAHPFEAFSGGRVGDQGALRSQIALGHIAGARAHRQPRRHHHRQGLGVEGRALLGAGGSPGRYNVPVNILVKSDSPPSPACSRRMSVVIPAGDTQGQLYVRRGRDRRSGAGCQRLRNRGWSRQRQCRRARPVRRRTRG